ncbi:hypothetical protein Tco_0556165 [Tanacetum coccineum]
MSTEVHQAAETVTTSNELDLLFGPLFDEYFNGENQVVLKSSAVTTTDASNKRQQQPDSTSSTSTLATTVTANGNFDLRIDGLRVELHWKQFTTCVRYDSLGRNRSNTLIYQITKVDVDIEECRHGPRIAMHNPSQPFRFLSKENLSHLVPMELTRYLLTSHSEIVDIE